MIRLFQSVVLLTVMGLTSCAGPKKASSKGASPAAVSAGSKVALPEGVPPAAKPPPPPDSNSDRDAFWKLAMTRYAVPANGIQPEGVKLVEPSVAVTPAPAVSPTPALAKPAIAAAPAHDLNPADIPFATWAPGKRGVVTSPYDPTGRLIDVRDFNAGQLSQCPYTGKIFRVPPLK